MTKNQSPATSHQPPKTTRRHFLKLAAGSTFALLIGCKTINNQQSTQNEPTPANTPHPTLNTQHPTPHTALPTVTPRPEGISITPVPLFYIQHFQSAATVDIADWQLTIDGLVENPITLTYDDILARPRAEMMRTLECIGNPVGGNQIGNANWAGIWLEDLLAEAKIKPTAVKARFEAADGYDTSVAMEFIDRPGVLLAYEMNGQPLDADHGYPLRIFMPGLYGQKMPKWITRIEFIDDPDHQGFWELQDWSETAIVKTNSQIQDPTHIARIPLEPIEIYGVAYAGNRTITQVEVGIQHRDNETTWHIADTLTGPSNEVWTEFFYTWTPPAEDSYTLLVRATDETGFVQTERATGILQGSFPDGTDKIHNIVVKAEANA